MSDRVGLTTLRDRVADVVAPVVGHAGFDLEQIRVTRAGQRHHVQVVVDRDGGVGLDAVAEVSTVVSTALDQAEATAGELVPGAYVLEVTSPGVDRPLTEPRHWRRNVGRLVAVSVAGEGRITGRVIAAGDSGVTMEIGGEARELRYGQLGTGRVQVELRRLADTGDPDAAGEGGT